MKKILAIALTFVMVLTLCACSTKSRNKKKQDNNENPSQSQTQTVRPTLPGKWVHELTDEEPYAMTLNFGEEGVGAMGKNGTNKLYWVENADGTFTITLERKGEEALVTKAYFTKDGDLCWEYEWTIKLPDGSSQTLTEIILKKQ